MFKFKKDKLPINTAKPESEIKERIIVIGNSVRTLYYSMSNNVKNAATLSAYSGCMYQTSAKEKEYHGKYWTDPRAPFELGGKDVVVTQVQGVLADDGQAYLLDVSRVIKVEK